MFKEKFEALRASHKGTCTLQGREEAGEGKS